MRISLENGLPIVSAELVYQGKSRILSNTLLDTGSSNTILDIDIVREIGIDIDPTVGKAKRMYGVGGESELCYERPISSLTIGSFILDYFIVQLGITKEIYGFDGILGTDFIKDQQLILDFQKMRVYR